MTTNDPQVPWTDEQWARVNQVVQEEASRARIAATFLPLIGPLPGDTDFVRSDVIAYVEPPDVIAAAQAAITNAIVDFNAAMAAVPPNVAAAVAAQQRIADAQAIAGAHRIRIDDRNTIQLATLQVRVPVRGAQIADPEMTSVMALFRRAANVLARLEDAVVFTGMVADAAHPGRFRPPAGVAGLHGIWEITGGEVLRGLLDDANTQPGPPPPPPVTPSGALLVIRVSQAIGILEGRGHFGPFALVLGNDLFVVAQTPDHGTLVLPQDRIIPFLGGGSLLRSSTLPGDQGVMVALAGAPVELIVATDMCLQFLQLTVEPVFVFRVCEKIALRIKEPSAVVTIR
jgi:uncharacterized linocin/CFP29 family protein